MKKALYILLFYMPALLFAQSVEYRMEKGLVYVTIGMSEKQANIDSLFKSVNVGQGFADSVRSGLAKQGVSTKKWVVNSVDGKYVVLKMPLNKFTPPPPPPRQPRFDVFMVENVFSPQKFKPSGENQFGFNRFKKYPNREDGATAFFYLPNNLEAKEVYLGGGFNNWNYEKLPMQKTDSGWVASFGFKPGLYLYKFVVDGQWQLDPLNEEVIGDYMGNENNGIYITNKVFSLEGFKKARKVYVATSFNNWYEKEIRLERVGTGWQKAVYIPEGTHAYKFIVDGNWLLDPKNPTTRKDANGIENSFLAIGDTFHFELNGFLNAQSVYVTGSFNGWQERELLMRKTGKGWRLPYVLGGGNYQYRFIVDNKWMNDPANVKTAYDGGNKNSLLVIKPNHTFSFPHQPKITEVTLVGTFTNWEQGSYPLIKQGDEWSLSLHMSSGKHLYKYIVNGQWMLDPTNALFEQNEYDTGNSVLWID